MSNSPHIPPQTRIILDSISDGVFTVDRDWRITFFNRSAEEITGVPASEALGKRCCEVFRANICESMCALRYTMETGTPVINRPVAVVRADGTEIPISIGTGILRDDSGEVMGGVESFRDLRLVETLRRELDKQYRFQDIIARSPVMRKLFALLPDIAQSGSSVLIQGETGTGKELFSRAIHNLSSRKQKPFIALNCGALPDTLLESELFGHTAGAFTDAGKSRGGRFAAAEGGTLFLDEIGDITPALQVRLLRVLEDGSYEPLGSSKTLRADVRIIAATHRDLASLVEEGSFRKDLYYRINVVQLRLPLLAERKEDIPLLAAHFIEKLNTLRNRSVTGLGHDALAIFMRHSWPGNIRELENALEYAFILCRNGPIRPEHLPETLQGESTRPAALSGCTLEAVERNAVLESLRRNDWRRMATARELGIDKNTLRRKILRLGIPEDPPA